jgi:ATP-dependent Clp protease ATP-binding subunit ClpA
VFERFTQDARAVVVATQELCRELGADEVGPVHLLLALAQEGSGVRDLFVEHGLTDDGIRRALGVEVGTPPDPRPLDEDDAEALRSLGIDLDAIRRAVEERFGPGALDGPDAEPEGAGAEDEGLVEPGPGRSRLRFGPARVRFGRGSRKVLELAVREAIRHGGREITTTHVALGVLRAGDAEVRRVLWQLSVDERGLRAVLESGMRRSA